MMKRFLGLLLALLLVCMQVASLAETAQLSETVTVQPGDTVKVYFSGVSAAGAYGFEISYSYDKSALEFVSAWAKTFQDATLLAPETDEVSMNGIQPGFNYYSLSTPFTMDAAFGYIEFKVKADAAPGTYSVTPTVEYAGDKYDNDVDFEVEALPGEIIVTASSSSTAPTATHTVTVNGGTGSGTYAVGSSVAIQANAAGENQAFTGWSGLEGLSITLGSAESTSLTFTMPDKDVALTAVYETTAVAPTYTLSFNANGGSGEMASISGVSGTYALPTSTFTAPAGKVFAGWSLEKDGAVLQNTCLVAADMNLYAIWADAPVPAFTAPTTAQLVEVTAGGKGTMTVSATNATSYQWYINRNDGKGYVAISGAKAASYTTSSVSQKNDGYTYYCVVTNAYGAAQSAVFTLNVKTALPATGDGASLAAWCAMLMISTVGVLVLRRKHA